MIRLTAAGEDRGMARRAAVLATSLLLLAGCGGGDEDSGASGGGSAGGGGDSAASAEREATVTLTDFEFMPETVTVQAGGSVTWTNEDDALHNAQTDDGAEGAFVTADLRQGDTDETTFEEPGTYAYYCAYHRFMTGEVEVEG